MVHKNLGNGVWECYVVNEPYEVNGEKYDGEYAGATDVFKAGDIDSMVRWEKAIKSRQNESKNWWDFLTIGDIYHYDNGFSNYVRCEVVEEDGEKKLQPIALVGDWKGHDLPSRRANGQVHYPHHAEKVVDRVGAWRCDTGCIYEVSERRQKGLDPRPLEAINLTVPDMTEEESRLAELENIRTQAIEVLQNYEDSVEDRLAGVVAMITQTLTNQGVNI